MKTTKEKRAYMATYQDTPENIKKREERNLARQHALKEGVVKKGDDKEIDHIDPLRKGGKNVKSNTRVLTAAKNRSWRAGKKGYDD